MTTYTVILNDPRYQEMLAHLQEKLVAEFEAMYGKLSFKIDYVFSFTPANQTPLTIQVFDPRHWELLVHLQDKLAAEFTKLYSVAPPTITYTFKPG